MMSADRHPEELIDRVRQGPLEPDEQSILDQHLAICAACAAHLEQAPRFEQELAAQPRDELLDRRAVEAAMLSMQRSSALGRRHVWPRWLRLAAAGVLLASVTATAAIIGRKVSSPAPALSPVFRTAEPPAARVAPPPVPALADVPGPAESPRPSNLPPRAASVRAAVTAAALFERAGKLRRGGRAEAAIAGYRRLQEAFPDARETRLSFTLTGQLLLERGRPNDALAQFERHSKIGEIGGDVGEEALVGRAAALEQLHRTADAIAAWKSLLERYPGSVYAGRARARLIQLNERR
jgi:anti-sigma factor RsiW